MATRTPVPPTTPETPEEPTLTENPAGAPEGVEQPSGPPDGHTTPQGPADAVQPTQAEIAEPTPTVLAYGETGDPTGDLDAYLHDHYPNDYDGGEHPATTAIRLLTRLGASAPVVRCPLDYCNLPAGHVGQCGWVHVEAR